MLIETGGGCNEAALLNGVVHACSVVSRDFLVSE
jgi:hypothetical protein